MKDYYGCSLEWSFFVGRTLTRWLLRLPGCQEYRSSAQPLSTLFATNSGGPAPGSFAADGGHDLDSARPSFDTLVVRLADEWCGREPHVTRAYLLARHCAYLLAYLLPVIVHTCLPVAVLRLSANAVIWSLPPPPPTNNNNNNNNCRGLDAVDLYVDLWKHTYPLATLAPRAHIIVRHALRKVSRAGKVYLYLGQRSSITAAIAHRQSSDAGTALWPRLVAPPVMQLASLGVASMLGDRRAHHVTCVITSVHTVSVVPLSWVVPFPPPRPSSFFPSSL